jgi:hypothetical protein
MVRSAACTFFLVLVSAGVAWAQSSSKQLVGTYQLELDASSLMDLRANGTAVLEGQEARWSVKGSQMTVGADTVTFQFKAGRLVMQMPQGLELAWRKVEPAPGTNPLQLAAAKVYRLQQAGPAPGGYGQPARPNPGYAPSLSAQPQPGNGQPAPAPAASAQDEQARQLLMSTAWCSFSYRPGMNNGNGVSETSRVVFRPDGTLFMGTGSDSYYSNPSGSIAGQGAGQNVMRWRVQNLRLLVDAGQGFQDIGLDAYKNSAGYPILKAQGKEYSMCK